MFTKSSLTALINVAPPLGVSIFMPTHIHGAEVRQDPIRLKNLAAQARDKLAAAGTSGADADALLTPVLTLAQDYEFWQHQNQGLALFLGGGEMRRHKVPLPLAEQVVVGPGFHVKPLLPVLAADGAFHVLTITADQVRLFDASRFSMAESDANSFPASLDEVNGGSDYQNPVQAAPVARPQIASITIGNAQA